VIDAQPGDLALADQTQDQLVGRVEHVAPLHADRGQVAHVEETAVVHLVAGHPPVGQAIGLRGEDAIEGVEGGGIARDPVEAPHRLLDVLADVGGLLGERHQPPLDDLLLAQPLLDPPGIGLGAPGQVLDRGQDATQLLEPRVLRAQTLDDRLEPVGQDLRVGPGGDRQARARVAQVEGAVHELERELLRLEHPAVLVGEDRQQHAVAQLALGRGPVDVEELGPRRGRAVLEHVEPPGVGVARDAHVVRHHVQDQAEPARGQPGGHPVEGGRAPQLRIERVVVGDVVAVGAAGGRSGSRGRDTPRDTERLQVGTEGRDLVEAERAPELQAIARAALVTQRRRRLLEEHVGVDHAA